MQDRQISSLCCGILQIKIYVLCRNYIFLWDYIVNASFLLKLVSWMVCMMELKHCQCAVSLLQIKLIVLHTRCVLGQLIFTALDKNKRQQLLLILLFSRTKVLLNLGRNNYQYTCMERYGEWGAYTLWVGPTFPSDLHHPTGLCVTRILLTDLLFDICWPRSSCLELGHY